MSEGEFAHPNADLTGTCFFMHFSDYIVIALFLLLVAAIGFVAYRKVKGSRDFFVAGGQIPWWLGGISHHISGHSGVVFVGLAAVAYEHGFTLYIWWAGSIVLACLIGAFTFAPRWSRLRSAMAIESPTEYLALRYNVATQQLMAWSGVLLKMFDLGAKWAAIGILMHGFTGLPVVVGIGISGAVTLCYTTVGGLWADLYNDFVQLIVQVTAGVVMFVAVASRLGGAKSVWTLWDRLPPEHSQMFSGPYTPVFLAGYIIAATLSYNGGTWNLAARYIGSPSAASARKTALLSGALYLLWPLVLFFPMWAAPVLLPNLAVPSEAYVMLARQYLPAGLVGLVLASMFSATTSMTASDTNAISSVITRDILPVLMPRFRKMDQRRSLRVARIATLLFMSTTLVIGVEADRFGGVLGLIISWFAALVGPVSVPMLFGLLPVYRHAGAVAAVASIVAGFVAFALLTFGGEVSVGLRVLLPVVSSITTFSLLAWLNRRRSVPAPVEELMRRLGSQPSQSSHSGPAAERA